MVGACSEEPPAGAALPSTATTAAVETTAAPVSSTTTATTTTMPPLTFPQSDSWTIEVVARHPHDPEAFTQGLLVRDDVVYESTGLYEMSSIRMVERTTGDVIADVPLDDGLFGEGLALVDDRLIQLTWREETALLWDATSLEPLGTFSYEGEGWGLCHTGAELVMSDGTAELDLRSPGEFSLIGSVSVTRDGEPVGPLNELECVGGLVFANVWQTDEILVIDLRTGDVVATIDAAPLAAEVGLSGDPRAVLNGIAYDSVRGSFLLTGKLWPTMFEVRFVADDPTADNIVDESAGPVSERLETRTLVVDGLERSFVLFTPDIPADAGRPALVVDLHGFTSTPDRHNEVSQLRTLAAAEGFVVAQPQGLGSIPNWDPSAAGRPGASDVAFIRAVVADVEQEVGIDDGSVFAMGFSNGGGMAHRLACDAADIFAAVGTVAGAYVDAADCAPDGPVAVASFHGTLDIVVPYEGAGRVFVNIPEWAAAWADRNGCATGPVRQDLFEDVYADAWSSCSADADVLLFTVVDGLHAWPGSANGGLFTSTENVSATEVFWDFFESHSR